MNDVKVLISFGAAGGGFELAWAIKHDLDEILGNGSTYLDAIFLSDDEHTRLTWSEQLGIWKMSNDNWLRHYVDAMNSCKSMLFIITEEWLESYYCWDEFLQFLKTPNCKPFFLITEQAFKKLENGGCKELSNGGNVLVQDITSLKEVIERNVYYFISEENSLNDYEWRISDTIVYRYNTKYSLLSGDSQHLISNIVSSVS